MLEPSTTATSAVRGPSNIRICLFGLLYLALSAWLITRLLCSPLIRRLSRKQRHGLRMTYTIENKMPVIVMFLFLPILGAAAVPMNSHSYRHSTDDSMRKANDVLHAKRNHPIFFMLISIYGPKSFESLTASDHSS